MKILSYTLFVCSASVKAYLIDKGVDPDTVYLNDYKFMKRVFSLLVTIFGYRPSVTLDQFFKFGFSEQKMILCCDVINLVRRAAKDIKLAKMLNRKRSSVSREASRGRFTVVDKRDEKRDYQYERDSVNKVARVSTVDERMLEQGEKGRSERFLTGTIRTNESPVSNKSKRFNSTSSRFRDTVGQSFNNCHRHHGESLDAASIERKLQEYAPLRSNGGNVVQQALQHTQPLRESHHIDEAAE